LFSTFIQWELFLWCMKDGNNLIKIIFVPLLLAVFKATQMITRRFYHFKGVTLSRQNMPLWNISQYNNKNKISKLKVDIPFIYFDLMCVATIWFSKNPCFNCVPFYWQCTVLENVCLKIQSSAHQYKHFEIAWEKNNWMSTFNLDILFLLLYWEIFQSGMFSSKQNKIIIAN
jgi:hypothetical protein